MEPTLRAREIIDVEIEALRSVRDSLGTEFEHAIEICLKALRAGGKIVVTGVGKNLHIGQKISATLASTGATSVVLNPTQALHGDLGILADHDVLLVLSYSGESEEILDVIPAVKRRGLSIVSLTGETESALAGLSDAVVPVTVQREACPFNMAPTASTTATLAVGDALAIVLLEARGFRKEDYARLHPRGAIGRALLCRVSEIMRTGNRLPAVTDSATVREVVLAMTSSKAGSAGIVDGDGVLLGILTDGDLRRHLTESSNLMELPVTDIMTANPVRVRSDQLAADALKLFEDRKVDDLLVVNETGKLVGLIDIQDLPGLKIF